MQAYIHYGLGFSGALLTKDEFEALCDVDNDPLDGVVGIRFRSFTEDVEGRDWGTVVLQDLGELPSGGKFCALADLEALMSPHRIIDKPTREAISVQLDSVGLSRLSDKVELVIFTDNY